MAKITIEDVHAAAADLDKQGIKPTTTKVREKLGRGSFSTIQEYLNSYDNVPADDEIPDYPDEFLEIMPLIWSKAYDLTADIFKKEIDEKTASITRLSNELRDLTILFDSVDNALENANEDRQSKDHDYAQLKIKYDLSVKNYHELEIQAALYKGYYDIYHKNDEIAQSKPEPAKASQVKPEPAKAAQAKPEPAKAAQAKPEQVKIKQIEISTIAPLT